jgi:hypothetical protein
MLSYQADVHYWSYAIMSSSWALSDFAERIFDATHYFPTFNSYVSVGLIAAFLYYALEALASRCDGYFRRELLRELRRFHKLTPRGIWEMLARFCDDVEEYLTKGLLPKFELLATAHRDINALYYGDSGPSVYCTEWAMRVRSRKSLVKGRALPEEFPEAGWELLWILAKTMVLTPATLGKRVTIGLFGEEWLQSKMQARRNSTKQIVGEMREQMERIVPGIRWTVERLQALHLIAQRVLLYVSNARRSQKRGQGKKRKRSVQL